MNFPDDLREREQSAYRALKHMFHDPSVSNSLARNLLDDYSNFFKNTPLLSSLKRKHFWHRTLRGYKYKTNGNDTIGVNYIKQRAQLLNQKGKTSGDILLVSHEMSLTGAPRALLNMALVLKQNKFNPYIFAFRGGELCREAERFNIPVIVMPREMFSIWFLDPDGNPELNSFFASFPQIMLNTMESILRFPIQYTHSSRILGWIHESAQSYQGLDCKNFEKLLDNFDEVYIVGEHARNNAMKLTSKALDFKNLYYGVEPIISQDLKPVTKFTDGKFHLLLAGTIEERKGHRVLGEALQLLSPEERKRIVIHCAGKTIHKSEYESLKSKGGDSVLFEGSLSHSDLIDLLRKCDGLICPSLDDPMPIVCTEAFQLQKPVLVSDKTGTASFIKDEENGFITKGGDASDLARGLRSMLKHLEKLPEIGKRSNYIYQANFSLDTFRNNILSIFDSSSKNDIKD